MQIMMLSPRVKYQPATLHEVGTLRVSEKATQRNSKFNFPFVYLATRYISKCTQINFCTLKTTDPNLAVLEARRTFQIYCLGTNNCCKNILHNGIVRLQSQTQNIRRVLPSIEQNIGMGTIFSARLLCLHSKWLSHTK